MLPSIHHREERMDTVFCRNEDFSKNLRRAHAGSVAGDTADESKWAVMPIAEGILGSLERLSDSSLQ